MKKRNVILMITILYTGLILYFMFLGFNRLDRYEDYKSYGYEFLFIPSGVPLNFPRFTFSWLYDFGNIAAFIPLGILFPLLYQVDYKKFIGWFMIVIFGLETIQSLVHLGTFDVNDVISNTIGATIGYVVYKVGFTSNLTLKKLIASSLSAIILLVCVMIVSEVLDKRVSPIQPLHAIKEITGAKPLTNDVPTFTVAGNKIEPQFNLYSNEGNTTKTYTYPIEDKEELTLFLNLGIPDHEEFKGEIAIITDGNVIFQKNEEDLKESETIEIMPLEIPLYYEAKKMTIMITGNIMLWDVGFTELKHWWE
ncbi:VanZ family protein [Lysinibacillus agricola]|uniref:VanZ family protein n=1 Tax=Lysinibacillus agricola TaxID=2590012 RepID=A0ABX7AZH3_9BACI|nr:MULTISPECIES: VanZ family protein [Lysinibacillus]KOS60176.1 VanZ family protein [Lysinibacillus sp. FJAT-14222]QQP14465.1 VanZ family protein [Lysinibacillus agricola]